MDIPPGLKNFLEMIGVNTTRLQWRLHQWEKNRGVKPVSRLPHFLRWLEYKHKFCPQCDALMDRTESVCSKCGAKSPSMPVYRALRALGLVTGQQMTVVTMTVTALCVVVYLLTIPVQGVTAIMHPTYETLLAFGSWTPQTQEAGEHWRLLAFGLMHIGLIHIGFNLYSFSTLGPLIEAELNSRRMLVLITVTQITAALGSVVYYMPRGFAITAGASGWLFGLIGFGVTYYHRQGYRYHHIRNTFVNWAIYSLVFGLFIRANNAAHVGGMLGGAVMGLLADLTAARVKWGGQVWKALFWPCVALWCGTLWFLGRSILDAF